MRLNSFYPEFVKNRIIPICLIAAPCVKNLVLLGLMNLFSALFDITVQKMSLEKRSIEAKKQADQNKPHSRSVV